MINIFNKVESSQDSYSPLKYPKPKILLLDMDRDIESNLKDAGYNVSNGSFGIPYKVPKEDGYQPVIVNGSMPSDAAEQEIIIINLLPRNVLDKPIGEKATSPGENDWWASCKYGQIDPRPRRMAWIKDKFDRILKHGGVFIIFADDKKYQELIWGQIDFDNLKIEENLSPSVHNWCFLSELNYLEIKSAQGLEIVAEKSWLNGIKKDHIESACYMCTLDPRTQPAIDRFISLAKNKFGDSVACAICPHDDVKGWIFIFPQIVDMSSFLISFLDEPLSVLCPTLFPDSEKAKWLRYPEYEIPSILEIKNRIKQIQEKTDSEIAGLEKECDEERQKFGYLQDLLSSSGDSLVISVKKTLESLGFSSIIDADEMLKKSSASGPKREDLRICDRSPIILIEIKGITGMPNDDDALQVSKYMIPRMKEWNRTDIQGLFIVNHQKNLPPFDRENNFVFRDDILANANEQGFGLLTTWDLFSLARSFKKNNWRHEHVKDIFYKKGRIDVIPSHYQYLGVIEGYAERLKVIGIKIIENEIKPGDRISFELPVEFEEQNVESLQREKEAIDLGRPGMTVGIKTNLSKEQAKKGVRVFKLANNE